MQPVLHCIDYYQHLIDNFQVSAKIRRSYKISGTLWDRKNHYKTLNGSWNWTPTQKSAIRNEDAYNKLLEAGVITDEIPFDPPYRHRTK